MAFTGKTHPIESFAARRMNIKEQTMNPHKETFKGCEIEITGDGNMTINGKQIDYEFDSARHKWSSRYLPYSHYDSLLDLAKAVVRDTEEFATISE
jgi:hypothetical protein